MVEIKLMRLRRFSSPDSKHRGKEGKSWLKGDFKTLTRASQHSRSLILPLFSFPPFCWLLKSERFAKIQIVRRFLRRIFVFLLVNLFNSQPNHWILCGEDASTICFLLIVNTQSIVPLPSLAPLSFAGVSRERSVLYCLARYSWLPARLPEQCSCRFFRAAARREINIIVCRGAGSSVAGSRVSRENAVRRNDVTPGIATSSLATFFGPCRWAEHTRQVCCCVDKKRMSTTQRSWEYFRSSISRRLCQKFTML